MRESALGPLLMLLHPRARTVTMTMTAPLRSLPRQQGQALRLYSHAPRRAFTAATRLRLKEDKARSAEEVDRVKEEQRQKAARGKGEWHEELASQSESHVAADREGVRDHDKHMEELQKQTANETQKKHPDAK